MNNYAIFVSKRQAGITYEDLFYVSVYRPGNLISYTS